MAQSLAQIYLHIVFSTKDRAPFLHDPAVPDEAHRYLGGTCNNLGCQVLSVGGWPITSTSYASSDGRLPWPIS